MTEQEREKMKVKKKDMKVEKKNMAMMKGGKKCKIIREASQADRSLTFSDMLTQKNPLIHCAQVEGRAPSQSSNKLHTEPSHLRKP